MPHLHASSLVSLLCGISKCMGKSTSHTASWWGKILSSLAIFWAFSHPQSHTWPPSGSSLSGGVYCTRDICAPPLHSSSWRVTHVLASFWDAHLTHGKTKKILLPLQETQEAHHLGTRCSHYLSKYIVSAYQAFLFYAVADQSGQDPLDILIRSREESFCSTTS